MGKQSCVIVGASHAGAQAAIAIRQQGWEGAISVISNEYYLPYHRPPLSKDYLSGAKTTEDLLLRPAAVYQKAEISFTLGATVTGIDRESKQLTLKDGRAVPYDKLVLTPGARVRKLDMLPGSDLGGVCYLKTIDDVRQVKAHTGEGKSAVIIGGGYIGLEMAASLRKQGMNVTVLEALPRILQRVTAPEVSAFYTRVHTEEGVNIVVDAQVESIQGEKKVEAVVCKDGTSYPANLVVIGVGVIPNTELAEAAGLEVNNGIVVDEYARTSDHDILAAGDCTFYYNAIYDRHIRLESVPNALGQATTVAETISGKENPYVSLPWFWSDQYDLKLQIAGLSQDYTDVVIRGDIEGSRSFAAFYMNGNRLLAVDAVNRPQEFMLCKRLIAEKTELDPARLADESIEVKDLVG